MRLGILATHPIQNHAPIFRELARQCDLTVYFAHRQTPEGQAQAGFGVPFEWDVDLLSGYDSAFLENRSRHPATSRFFGCDTPEIDDAIGRGRFDAFMVTGWGVKCYWQAIWACRRRRIPTLIRGDSQLPTQRSLSWRLLKEGIYPLLLRSFDGFMYVGRRNRDYLRHYHVREDRLFFSPHCIDNDRFASNAEPDHGGRRQGDGDPKDTKSVLFVGKLAEGKRPFDIIRALALPGMQERRTQAVFVGAGEVEDGLRREAAHSGVPAVFHGFQNQSAMPSLYASADLLVLPSDQETWGLVVNEAMACGVPAVVSEAVGCGPDLIEPGRTGAVFPVGDIAALAEAIRSTLALERSSVRRHLNEKMAIYSPAGAARGIIEGAGALSGRQATGQGHGVQGDGGRIER
jgi:glycosyltransferase involved in cell wall biosynthesis